MRPVRILAGLLCLLAGLGLCALFALGLDPFADIGGHRVAVSAPALAASLPGMAAGLGAVALGLWLIFHRTPR